MGENVALVQRGVSGTNYNVGGGGIISNSCHWITTQILGYIYGTLNKTLRLPYNRNAVSTVISTKGAKVGKANLIFELDDTSAATPLPKC
jgi:hypothetical protein